MLGSEKINAASQGRLGPSDHRIGIKHPKVIEWPLRQPLEQQFIFIVSCAAAELVPQGTDASLEVGDRSAEVMADDFQFWQPFHHARENKPCQRDAAVVRPT